MCFLSELAENKLLQLSDFIRKLQFKSEGWSLTKLTSKIDQISDQPESCVQSTDLKGFLCNKTDHFLLQNKFWQKRDWDYSCFDTRRNTSKLDKDIY
jgi:hypothetical protein